MKKHNGWLILAFGTVLSLSAGSSVLAGPKDKAEKVVDLTPKANPALRAKIDARIAPFTWGMSSEKVFGELDKQLNELYAEKAAKTYNPKAQDALEKERDKKKKELRTKLTKFDGAGISGYEVKAPGEFTHKNSESAIEVPRAGGGTRQLFFINDKLWKVYDQVELTNKDAELGETWDQAIEKIAKAIGEKGKTIPAKSTVPAYFGTTQVVPQLVLWSDGVTQARLVDHTKREDMPNRTVGIAYEELATVEKLPTLRSNIEKKHVDTDVQNAAAAGSANDSSGKKKK